MHTRYRIENTIGQGGMGTILRAYDRLTHTWVALKQLLLENQPDPTASTAASDALRTALATEFRLLATLRHPHIVSVLDYGFVPTSGQPTAFFTMEHLTEATPLTQAAARLPWAAQLPLLGQLLQTLEYVRRHGVIHRDLKPENVLVQQGQVKVLDFGLAVFEGHASTSEGSLFYMAPEAFVPGQPLTHATDLFAVGIMAYEMLAGRHPFHTTWLSKVIENITQHEPDYTYLLGPAALRPVVARLLAKDPTARYPTAGDALAALTAASGLDLPLETPASRASLIQSARLVGRATEMAQLNMALHRALQGQGQAVLVGGESGVGKSRLLDELRVGALIQGAQVWLGQAISEGGVPAQLWHTILRWLAISTAPSALEASVLKPFVPDLETLLARPVSDAPALESKAAQDRFCSTVLTLLRQATARQPIVLLLEDVHWAGPLSQAVLAWVIRVVDTLPLLLIATYRNDEAPTLPTGLPPTTVLPLTRLDAAQTTALASAIFGRPVAELTALAQFLYAQTEGNTFFVVEVLRSLAAEVGLLALVENMALPEQLLVGGMQAVVQRRLQRLAPTDYAWLETAATVGRELDLPLLHYLDPNWDWAAWLTRCAEAAVLEPQGAAWHFAHDQLRQGLFAQLAAPRARQLHQAIAEAIEQVYAAQLTPHLRRLAYHYTHTDRLDKQQHYLTVAAQAARDAYDFATALRCYDQLLPLLTDPATQLACYLGRGAALEALGQWATAEHSYLAALALAANAPSAHAKAQMALGKLSRLRGDCPAALNWLAQAQTAYAALDDRAGQAQAWVQRGCVFVYQSEYVAAQAALQIGLALARQVGDMPNVALALNNLNLVAHHWGDFATAKTLCEESLALRQQLGDKPGTARLLNNLGLLAYDQSDYPTAQRLFSESLALKHELGDKDGIVSSLGNLGCVAHVQGDYATAQSLYAESLALARALGAKLSIVIALNNLGAATLDLGHVALAKNLLTECVALCQTLGERQVQAWGLLGLGLVALSPPCDLPTARAHLCQSLLLAQEISAPVQQVSTLIGLAGVAYHANHPARAAQWLGAAAAALHTLNAGMEIEVRHFHAQLLAVVQTALGAAAFKVAWALGEKMPLDDALTVALEITP